jgi:transposase
MTAYSEERKAAILKKIIPPSNRSILEIAREENIAKSTLYKWQGELKLQGEKTLMNQPNKNQWSAEAKFGAVIESATLSELELGEYCRKKGLYLEDIKRWKQACITGQTQAENTDKQQQNQQRADQKRIRELEKELLIKDKALAETTALLVLQKKFKALLKEGAEN